jgi:DNA-binding LytR/AlgR family response regulator
MTAESVVFLRDGCRSRMVRVGDIVTIDVSGNNMTVKLSNDEDGAVVVRGSLSRCLRKLPAELFFRAGRDCVVNLGQVARVDAAARQIVLRMRNGREVVVSRKQSLLLGRWFAL